MKIFTKETLRHKALRVLWALLLFSSCHDEFDLDRLQNPSKLVVYCFPSGADTTYVSVSNSIGVKKYTDEHRITTLADAQVRYAVNGVPRPVEQLPGGTFFVVGSHQAGDRVSVSVSHVDYAPVEALTTVPAAVPIELRSVREVTKYDSYWYEVRHFYQLQATFTDPAATADYYAVGVQVTGTDYTGERSTVWQQIETLDEPLLRAVSDIDEDFGFENDFYGNFYIFSDQDINGLTYTLHLDLERSDRPYGYPFNHQYRVVLYKISPEYYHFLKSINDVENNELAQGGFAQLMPTFTNVSGGIGVVGAYWAQPSNWRPLEGEED